MKISYDPAADALYIELNSGNRVDPGETIVNSDGVIVDTDSNGNPRGFEFLSVSVIGVSADTLPERARKALSDFVSSGCLESELFVEKYYLE